jgi:signal transduction histidine kinase
MRNHTGRLEMIGSATAGIAHDINNQLTLIVNHLAIGNVESAQMAAERCGALTASLLSYCKGERVLLKPVDPVAFLRTFAPQLRLPKGIHLVLSIPASLPEIAADPLAMMRALTNLVSNAVGAMNGKGALYITALPGRIEVGDSGPGIPPENRKRVFEPFFSTKGMHGTGLGLSIVREIMRQHGGSVTMLSEPGSGARFTLRFRPAYGVTAFRASPRKIAPAA